MWFAALATDYDGTLATDGVVTEASLAALTEFKKSGRRLLLVTGRRLVDLLEVFPEVNVFDIVVAENGAVLYVPSNKEVTAIAPSPPENLVKALQDIGVTPLEIGESIVATWLPNERLVLDAIHGLGLEHQVIFNKGAVMILPPGVNKATGLTAALRQLGLSEHNVVGVGDAQNDLAFLTACECSVAVDNALPSVKEVADIRTKQARGAGVEEILKKIIETDLQEFEFSRHNILLGTDEAGKEVYINPRSSGLLIAGTSGSGKSTAVTGLLERLGQKSYQFALIDPEGDYEILEGAISVGNTQHAPTADEAAQHLKSSEGSVVINLLGLPLADRPDFLGNFFPRINSMRDNLGRPHWIAIDEAHHMLPRGENHILQAADADMTGVILITVHPDELAVKALQSLDQVLIVGHQPKEMIASFAKTVGEKIDFPDEVDLAPGEGVFWQKSHLVRRIKIAPPHTERRRHLRKYAEGDVGKEKSFYFKGADNKLNLRVQNLILFVQISEGLDDETWLYHLRQAEYSKWFATAIKDEELAEQTAAIEEDNSLSPADSKTAIHNLIKARYTASAVGPQLNSDNILM